jgi:hypothetical protein
MGHSNVSFSLCVQENDFARRAQFLLPQLEFKSRPFSANQITFSEASERQKTATLSIVFEQEKHLGTILPE